MPIKTALSILLLFPLLSFANCYQLEVEQAVQDKNIERLARLLTLIETQTNCSTDYLEQLKRRMAVLMTTQAEALIQQTQCAQAEELLQNIPMTLWRTQLVRATCAVQKKDWIKATKFYNKALDLIADIKETPQAPPLIKIKEIFQLASETQVLSGNLDATITYAGKATGMMRDKVRNFTPKKRIIPLPFDDNHSSVHLSKKGKMVARQLGAYFKQYAFTEISLIGHQNPEVEACACISKRYIQALKVYLIRKAKIEARILTSSQGDRQPLALLNPEYYTPAEIKTLNRRVELVVK